MKNKIIEYKPIEFNYTMWGWHYLRFERHRYASQIPQPSGGTVPGKPNTYYGVKIFGFRFLVAWVS
jgi:hypothetical protein